MRQLVAAVILILGMPGVLHAADAKPTLNPQIQDAHWIWLKGWEDKPNSTLYARKTFSLDSEPVSAVLQISCDNEYKVWINGSLVGETMRRGDYAWRNADIYSIKSGLREGENHIAVQCTNYHGQGALIATLVIDAGGGQILRVDTDSSWQMASEPGEDWLSGGPGGDWQPALDYGRAATTAPWFAPRPPSEVTALIDRLKIPLKSTIVSPVAVKLEPSTSAQVTGLKTSGLRAGAMNIRSSEPRQKVVVTCDFGKQIVGYPIVIGFAQGSGTISAACGEYEAECDNPYQPVVTHQFKIGGIRWAVPDRRAFRYLRLTIEPPAEMNIETIQAESVGRGAEQAGSFRCSDPVLNNIYDISAYTVQLCMQDYYEDGVKRDRLLWTGDLRVEALVGYYCFGEVGLARRSLMQLADLQLADGLIPGVGPNPSSTYLPDYCAYWAIALADYYRHTGDETTLRLLYPTLQKLMDWFQANCDETGVFRNADRPGWWIFVDWDESMEKKDRVMATEALYHWALKDAAELALAVRNRKDAAAYGARAEKLRETINTTMWSARASAYVDCLTDQGPSERIHKQPNALALLAGLPDADKTRGILAALTDDSKTPPVTTPYMNFYVASALFEAGSGAAAIDLVRKYWGAMVERGATTFWEKFDPTWPVPYEQADLSYCHGWSAGPGMLLPACVAGVRPSLPGWKSAIIKPDLGELEWVKAAVPTPNGIIKVDWKNEGALPVGSVALPRGCEAKLVLPTPPDGTHYLVDGKRAKVKREGPNVILQLKRGRTYTISLG